MSFHPCHTRRSWKCGNRRKHSPSWNRLSAWSSVSTANHWCPVRAGILKLSYKASVKFSISCQLHIFNLCCNSKRIIFKLYWCSWSVHKWTQITFVLVLYVLPSMVDGIHSLEITDFQQCWGDGPGPGRGLIVHGWGNENMNNNVIIFI